MTPVLTYGPNRDSLTSLRKRSEAGGPDHAIRRAFWDRSDRKTGRLDAQIIDVAGSCTSPVVVRYDHCVDLEYHARCRKCPGCLRARQYLWKLRGEAEFLASPQTIFFTGTFRDQYHDIEPVRDEVTRFLKRARKRAVKNDHNFRYLMVPERHKSGAWHYHGLFHVDYFFDAQWIEDAWTAGWNWAKWADINGADYVTKYVAKDLVEDQNEAVPRIRASRNPTYGGWVMCRDEEKVKELLAERGEECLIETWRKNLQQYVKEEQIRRLKARDPKTQLLRRIEEVTASK